MTLALQLPFPPSVNSYWRTVSIKGKNRTLISAKGRQYRIDVLAASLQHRGCFGPDKRLSVTAEFRRKDRRRYDLDNFTKAMLDGIQHAGVYADDGQIDQLTLARGTVGDDCVVVWICEV